MARAIWKGSISFGLVHVPVGLHAAETRDELHLSMLDSRDLAPIGYRRVNKQTGEEVEREQIVKGYEYQKGEYVLLNEEDFRQANPEATQTVELLDFVDLERIPLVYYDKPYYLEPLKRGEKGYALLRETLKRTGKVGIGKVVLRTRQYLAALVPQERMLVLNLLRYAHELRDPASFNVPPESLDELGISDREITMAESLVETMSTEWEPGRYRDDYREDLLHRVEEKVARGEARLLTPVEAAPLPAGAEVIDLMAQLKRSVEETRKNRKRAKRGNGRQKRA